MIEFLIFAPIIVAVWLIGVSVIFFVLAAWVCWYRG